MKSTNLILNRLFSKNLFFKLANQPDNATYNTIIKRFIKCTDNHTNGELIKEIYSYMVSHYRNEYIYQNILFNKLLLGKHSLATTTALNQVPIGKSKADFILINGKAIVYEIKTELDTFERLKSQLLDYYKAFTLVCLVISESHYKQACDLFKNEPIGIYVLSKNNTISQKLRREPSLDYSKLDYSTIFKVLRKSEFESIIEYKYGKLPNTTQAFYYNECFNLFSKIKMMELYNLFLKQLKKRKKNTMLNLNQVPTELKSLVYFTNPKKSIWNATADFLANSYSGG